MIVVEWLSTTLSAWVPASHAAASTPASTSAHDSLASGSIQPALPPKTVADGLRTPLGELNFAILSAAAVEVILVGEEAILAAMRLVWTRMKLVVEPSAAVPLAALLSRGTAARTVGIILSGGNVDPTV